jgi:glycosyltransferase involved in cell wall biosynthesis
VTLTPRLNRDIEAFVPASKISSVPNAIPWAPLPPRSRNSPRITGLFLSNFDRAKGALDVVHAAHRLRHLRGHLRLVLCGGVTDRSFHAELERSIAKLDVNNLIELRGPAYGEEKEQILASADFLVFPTSYPLETFGLVNLEAMRAGIPVIATNVGGIPDVVEHGETGLLIAPGDIDALVRSIEIFVEDQALRNSMGRRGRARFEQHFSLDRFATNWSDVLRRLAT